MSKIYFIQQGDDGPIKIGTTWGIKSRLEQISVSSPYKLKILALITGSVEKERSFHKKFKKEHLRGEWFRPSDRLMEFIRALPNNNVSQPIEMDGEKLLTPLDLGEVLSFKPDRILLMANKGNIPFVKVKGMIYFKPSELNIWLKGLEKKSGLSQNPPQSQIDKKVVSLSAGNY